MNKLFSPTALASQVHLCQGTCIMNMLSFFVNELQLPVLVRLKVEKDSCVITSLKTDCSLMNANARYARVFPRP